MMKTSVSGLTISGESVQWVTCIATVADYRSQKNTNFVNLGGGN